jgi:hypothetical protein
MVSITRPVSSGGAEKLPVDDGEIAGTGLDRAIRAVELNSLWTLGALMLLEALILLYMGRGFSFFGDDWAFVTNDYGGGFHSLMLPHVGNISVFPIAVYKVMFHLVGLSHYIFYRLMVVVLHLVSAGLIFMLTARRIPRAPALLATVLILFLGAAWEDLLWAFQIGYLLSIVGGLATWVLLERKDRLGDTLAMLCLIIAAGSSSLGIAIMVGIAVELLWRCGDRRRMWIVIVPAILYALWYLGYGESQITESSLIAAPGYVEELIAAAFGGLIGRGLEWGRPLALVALLVLMRRLVRPLPVSPRLAGLLATGIALWVITAAARSTISTPESSRYIYLGAVVIVLVGVELLRGVPITPRAIGLATVLILFSVITGLTVMRNSAIGRRENAEAITAELGALELAAAHAPADYELDPKEALGLLAGPYLHTVRAIGSTPADTPTQITKSEPAARADADAVLVQLGVAKLSPLGATKPSVLARAPATISLAGATESQYGACLRLTPTAFTPMVVTLVLPTGGAIIRDRGASAISLATRRFGETFHRLSGPVSPHGGALLSISADSAPVPWQLQITSSAAVETCGVLP